MTTPASENKLFSKRKTYYRPVVVADLPDTISDFIGYAHKLPLLFANSPFNLNPNPGIAQYNADLAILDKKQAIAKTRLVGSASERNIAMDVTRINIFAWKAYIQLRADLDKDNAVAIIESAGFKVKHVSRRVKDILKAIKGKAPNSVKLTGKALGRKIAYEWQYSTDGHNWNSVFATPMADTIINDLLPATVYYFRYRGNRRTEGQWCDMIAYLTHLF